MNANLFTGLLLCLLGLSILTPANAQFDSFTLHVIDGMNVQSPVKLTKCQNEDLKFDYIKQSTTYEGRSVGLFVSVSSIEYSADRKLSLAEGANGQINSILKLPDVSSPKSSIVDTTISGLPAKRVSVSLKAEGKDICMESIILKKGQHIWNVMLTSEGPVNNFNTITTKSLNSVHLNSTLAVAPDLFTSKDGRFSIKCPANLVESTSTQTIALPDNNASCDITTYCFSGVQDDICYSINYADFPPSIFAIGDPVAVSEILLNKAALAAPTLSRACPEN